MIAYPKGEIVWEQIYSGGELKYLVTSKQARDLYFLYELQSGKFVKIAKAKTPPELFKKIRIE